MSIVVKYSPHQGEYAVLLADGGAVRAQDGSIHLVRVA